LSKRQKEKLRKELRLLCGDNTISQEVLIKIIKAVVVALASSNDDSLYHDLLEAIGVSYKDALLKDWEATINKASKIKSSDGLLYSM
jgi:hypothetical protein